MPQGFLPFSRGIEHDLESLDDRSLADHVFEELGAKFVVESIVWRLCGGGPGAFNGRLTIGQGLSANDRFPRHGVLTLSAF
jgi:hypothetical protein